MVLSCARRRYCSIWAPTYHVVDHVVARPKRKASLLPVTASGLSIEKLTLIALYELQQAQIPRSRRRAEGPHKNHVPEPNR